MKPRSIQIYMNGHRVYACMHMHFHVACRYMLHTDTDNDTRNEKEHPLGESQVVLGHGKDISVKRK